MDQKIFISDLSVEKDWQKEVHQIAKKVKKGLHGASCDLVVFFVSESYKDFDPQVFSRLLTEEFACRMSLGCNSSGIICDDREVEMEHGLSILAMHLPGVAVHPFVLSAERCRGLESGTELIGELNIFPSDKPHFVLLADPASCDVMRVLRVFNEGYKGLPVIGGLASGGMVQATNWLSLNGRIYAEGAVGVALTGEIQFEVIVSQGCRPIGQSYAVTRCEKNILLELGGRPALTVLREILSGLTAPDRALAEHSLFAGLVMNENQPSFKRGDFLVRNIMGFDPASGALALGAYLKVGQTLQFQLRDAKTSSEDLGLLLGKLSGTGKDTPQGAILVSCCGRGKNLFGEDGHDARMIQSAKGPVPMTGFFANGEIGPVGQKNYVHGYTSSLVFLR